MIIPEEFIIQKFYQHAGYPKYIKSTNTYMGGCPVCREGNSWGRKSRCYYIPKDTVICCHNCGWYSKPIAWVMEVEQITYDEIVRQVKECDYEYGLPVEQSKIIKPTQILPQDCINLFDREQISFYKQEEYVKKAIDLILKRRLNTAKNKPKSLFVSLKDNVHKNRLIIPFYDRSGECIHYQSRTIGIDENRPKYLSKVGSEKSLFNYNNVSSSADNVFITEGPIDSFFIRDSVAVAGIQERSANTFTQRQKSQLDRLFLMQHVWVLDSQWLDSASKLKTEVLLKSGMCVFLWPRDVGRRFKDINDMCVYFKIDEISPQYIMDNTYCGLKGIVKLKQIR